MTDLYIEPGQAVVRFPPLPLPPGTAMNEESIEVLQVVQEVLRQLFIALAIDKSKEPKENKERLRTIADLLESAATNNTLSPMARHMLADLASMPMALATAGERKQ